jgi:uridine phosphorylase
MMKSMRSAIASWRYALRERDKGWSPYLQSRLSETPTTEASRMPESHSATPPILTDKHYDAPSAFTPESLLRAARRQKGLPQAVVPAICLLDPDGDLLRRLRAEGRAARDSAWACYHTELYRFVEAGIDFGIVGCAVGAAFAVLIAEELFAAGCRFLLSMTSAGQLAPHGSPPYFILIDRALRDEGTSYHYLAPAEFSFASDALLAMVQGAFEGLRIPVLRGATWTTDAPFRETAEAIAVMKGKQLLAVEMEAAALYAFAEARGKPVLCFAHVTNQMGRIDGDFEKGEANGAVDALAVISRAAARVLSADRLLFGERRDGFPSEVNRH